MDIERLALAVRDVADDPVVAGPMAGGEVMTADRLGVAREAIGQLRSGQHGDHTGPVTSTIGCRSTRRATIADPSSDVGMKNLSSQAIVSENRPMDLNLSRIPVKPLSATRWSFINRTRRNVIPPARATTEEPPRSDCQTWSAL